MDTPVDQPDGDKSLTEVPHPGDSVLWQGDI